MSGAQCFASLDVLFEHQIILNTPEKIRRPQQPDNSLTFLKYR